MKKVFIILVSALISFTLSAQEVQSSTPAVSTPKTEFLRPFNKVSVAGPITITFKHVTTPEQIKIVYDTQGNVNSRFRAEIDRNGVLQITERAETKQIAITTTATVYYMLLDDIEIAHATAVFENTIDSRLCDLIVTGGADVKIDIDALDLRVKCTGKSLLNISGQTRYFDLDISTAKMNGFDLNTVAARIEASHDAQVEITATERLEAITATAAKLSYKGNPTILRNKNSLFGGEIVAID